MALHSFGQPEQMKCGLTMGNSMVTLKLLVNRLMRGISREVCITKIGNLKGRHSIMCEYTT